MITSKMYLPKNVPKNVHTKNFLSQTAYTHHPVQVDLLSPAFFRLDPTSFTYRIYDRAVPPENILWPIQLFSKGDIVNLLMIFCILCYYQENQSIFGNRHICILRMAEWPTPTRDVFSKVGNQLFPWRTATFIQCIQLSVIRGSLTQVCLIKWMYECEYEHNELKQTVIYLPC